MSIAHLLQGMVIEILGHLNEIVGYSLCIVKASISCLLNIMFMKIVIFKCLLQIVLQ